MSEQVTDINELDGLDPVTEKVKLSSGLVVHYQSLKTKQFFKLLRIITRGARHALSSPELLVRADATAEEWGQKLLALILVAIPDAEEEALDFIRSMVTPDGLIERKGRSDLSKTEKEHNEQVWLQFYMDLENPELEDTLTIIEDVVKRESKDLAALGKRLGAMMSVAKKTGQISKEQEALFNLPTSSEANSSEGSAEPSTSSPVNMGGPTTLSMNLPSDDSGNVSQP